jgi:hypothetical protein
MTLYHRTTLINADLILRDGFRDEQGRYTSDFGAEGVWFSDVPKDAGECDADEVVVEMDVGLSVRSLAAFERSEDEATGYREWLIPAALVNSKMKRTRIC